MTNKNPENLNEILLAAEQKFMAGGEFSFAAGIDEAGRGCLAGPVVAAAVVFTDYKNLPEGINDSKKITPEKRSAIADCLMSMPNVKYGIGIVSPQVIDEINILQATWQAMRIAAEKVIPPAQLLLVDGNPVQGLPIQSVNVIKGDAKFISIAAASIIAKTSRDRIMEQYETEYPGYGFAAHKGYGTASHIEAIKRLGVLPVHRKTFAPVRQILFPPDFEQKTLF